jgi:Na+/melibiose symporter-like transporter
MMKGTFNMTLDLSKYDWKHGVLDACAVGTLVCEGLAQVQRSGHALPWHITAAGLFAVTTVLGHITRSLTVPGAALWLLGLASATTGCATLSATPIVPETPANQAQITACQGYGVAHNGSAIGAIGASLTTTALGSVGAAENDPTTQRDLAIGAIVAGAIDAALVAFASIESVEYAQGQCGAVLGTLPLTTKASRAP